MHSGKTIAKRTLDEDEIGRRAAESYDVLIRRGIEAYDRRRHLPRILPVEPAEVADVSPSGLRSILARLARALRAERNRGRAGHWTYDLNRHIALAQAYESERRLLRRKPPS